MPNWWTPATTATSGAQQYSRKSSDIFALQGDLAKEMTSMLRMRLTGEDEKQMMKSYTANPEAYQALSARAASGGTRERKER